MYGGELQVDRSVVIDLLLSGIYLGLTFVAQSAGRFIEESCIRFVFFRYKSIMQTGTIKNRFRQLWVDSIAFTIGRFQLSKQLICISVCLNSSTNRIGSICLVFQKSTH